MIFLPDYVSIISASIVISLGNPGGSLKYLISQAILYILQDLKITTSVAHWIQRPATRGREAEPQYKVTETMPNGTGFREQGPSLPFGGTADVVCGILDTLSRPHRIPVPAMNSEV